MLRESLLRLAVTSYQNTAFWNPESKEREEVAMQFLTMLLPTVGGVGKRVGNVMEPEMPTGGAPAPDLSQR